MEIFLWGGVLGRRLEEALPEHGRGTRERGRPGKTDGKEGEEEDAEEGAAATATAHSGADVGASAALLHLKIRYVSFAWLALLGNLESCSVGKHMDMRQGIIIATKYNF